MNPQPPITRRCPFCGAPTHLLYVDQTIDSMFVRYRVQCRFCNASGPTTSTQPNCPTLDTAIAIAASIFDWNHRSTTAEWGAGGSSEAALKLYGRRNAFINKHCNPAKPTKKGKTMP
jgi:hypothetical protein